ncbi:hypothetical protein DNTS_006119 [Danionella cerebrum]|uniref:C2H2-type domain-containing protein n=1 Tax=Danionella cerebrum TaxID=2873325 RepID=A0A553NR99_9TELE|nr:hypothetical protein DNTS_006119 [Danionella translucida]
MEHGASLPSLCLLVSPLRLTSAFMWQIVMDQNIEQFGKLEEFVTVMTNLVPELLSRRQRASLIVGLRAKMILEMCRGELPADLHSVRSHIHNIQTAALLKANETDTESLQVSVLQLVLSLLEDSVKREQFFQEVFPVEYGPDFDKALQVLVGFFLSRLEQLLPVPNFKQLSLMLSSYTGELDPCVDSVCNSKNLLPLLQSGICGTLEENVLPSIVEDRIFSSLSLPPVTMNQRSYGAMLLPTDPGSRLKQSVKMDPEVLNVGSSSNTEIYGYVQDSKTSNADDFLKMKFEDLRVKHEVVCPPQPPSLKNSYEALTSAPAGFHYAGRTVHRCRQCSEFFIYCSDLVKHQEVHAKSAAHKCSQCGQICSDLAQLASHRNDRCSSRVFKCIKCAAHFRSLRNLYKHNRMHKEKTTHKCPECGRLFTSLSHLVSHRRAHQTPRNYTCKLCNETFGSYRASLIHQKVHRGQAVRLAKAQRLPGKCRFCDLTFTVEGELRAHLKTHAEFRPYICDQCGKCFSANSSLLAHLSNHTGEKPLLCSQCGKRFYSKIQLKSHMRCHSGERPHVCPYCDKQFTMSGNLKIHIRIHTGEKPYVCHQCGKGFVSAGCLQVHLRSHTGEKPYQCKICGKKFVVSSHLTAHMCFHTGERRHCCLQCGKRFVRRYDLSKHMYTHIGKRPFPCPVCPKAYTCRTHLNRHMKSHRL